MDHNASKSAVAGIVLCRGRNPKFWTSKTELWNWIPEGCSVILNVGHNRGQKKYTIERRKGKLIFNTAPLANNPLSLVKLEDAIATINELDEICTHVSPEMYAKIEQRGVEALRLELKKDTCTLEQALDKLTATLRKAIAKHENTGTNERTRRSEETTLHTRQ